jgi:hypothetical protein
MYNYARQQRSWGHSMYPGEENSEMRHCVVSCIMAKQYGTATARAAGCANELQGYFMIDLPLMAQGLTLTGSDRDIYLGLGRLVGEVPFAFQLSDLEDNERGFDCAESENECDDGIDSDKESCIKCCGN